VRKNVAVIVAACFVAVTAGCSAIPAPTDCDPLVESGVSSKLISATGDEGTQPTVTFPTPIAAKDTQVSSITPGTGDELFSGQVADVQASIYSGATGALLTTTGYDPTSPLRVNVGLEGSTPAISVIAESIQCQAVGSRTATVVTVADMFGADTLDPTLGLANDDAVVVVTDVAASYLGRATGALQPIQSGMPAVVTDTTGIPGISLPSTNPPTELKIADIRTGDGATVKEGDGVVLQYTGVLWNEAGTPGTVFQSTWTDSGARAATTLTATAMDEDGAGGLVPGFAQALIGAKVGSQVLAVIPPEFGYPEGSSPGSIPDGSTMVFVIDVLGIQ